MASVEAFIGFVASIPVSDFCTGGQRRSMICERSPCIMTAGVMIWCGKDTIRTIRARATPVNTVNAAGLRHASTRLECRLARAHRGRFVGSVEAATQKEVRGRGGGQAHDPADVDASEALRQGSGEEIRHHEERNAGGEADGVRRETAASPGAVDTLRGAQVLNRVAAAAQKEIVDQIHRGPG